MESTIFTTSSGGGFVNEETVIAKMAQKDVDYHGVQFLCVYVLEMTPFADNSFTLIIDKACFDAIMCGTEFRQMSKSMFEPAVSTTIS